MLEARTARFREGRERVDLTGRTALVVDDGIATGDTDTIIRLGMVMLAVTAGQVVCAVGAVYFGSRAGMGFGRDLRSAMFHHVTTFSEHETARFGASSRKRSATSTFSRPWRPSQGSACQAR